jgi:hypothetical protein
MSGGRFIVEAAVSGDPAKKFIFILLVIYVVTLVAR